MFYGLQTASANLRRLAQEQKEADQLRTTEHEACLAEILLNRLAQEEAESMARRGIKPGDRPKDPPASDTAFWDRVRKAQEMLAQGDLRQPPNHAAPAPLASGY